MLEQHIWKDAREETVDHLNCQNSLTNHIADRLFGPAHWSASPLNDVLMLFCLIWTVRLWSTWLSRDSPNPNFPNRDKFSSALWVYIRIINIWCISLNSTLVVLHARLTEAFSYVHRCKCMPVSWLFSVMYASKITWVQSCERKLIFHWILKPEAVNIQLLWTMCLTVILCCH